MLGVSRCFRLTARSRLKAGAAPALGRDVRRAANFKRFRLARACSMGARSRLVLSLVLLLLCHVGSPTYQLALSVGHLADATVVAIGRCSQYGVSSRCETASVILSIRLASIKVSDVSGVNSMVSANSSISAIHQSTSAHIGPDAAHNSVFSGAPGPAAAGFLASRIVATSEAAGWHLSSVGSVHGWLVVLELATYQVWDRSFSASSLVITAGEIGPHTYLVVLHRHLWHARQTALHYCTRLY